MDPGSFGFSGGATCFDALLSFSFSVLRLLGTADSVLSARLPGASWDNVVECDCDPGSAFRFRVDARGVTGRSDAGKFFVWAIDDGRGEQGRLLTCGGPLDNCEMLSAMLAKGR